MNLLYFSKCFQLLITLNDHYLYCFYTRNMKPKGMNIIFEDYEAKRDASRLIKKLLYVYLYINN